MCQQKNVFLPNWILQLLILNNYLLKWKLIKKKYIYLVVCYIPLGSPSIFIHFIASLEWLLATLPANNKIIVTLIYLTHSENAEVLYFFSENGFLQYSQIFNDNNVQLNLVFSNVNNTIVTSCPDNLVPVDGHHPVRLVFWELSSTLNVENNVINTFNYNKAVYDLITYALNN